MPWRYAEPPYTSMPSYRMTDIRFAIGGIGAGAGRQRRRPLHRSISRHSGHPVTSPSTTPPADEYHAASDGQQHDQPADRDAPVADRPCWFCRPPCWPCGTSVLSLSDSLGSVGSVGLPGSVGLLGSVGSVGPSLAFTVTVRSAVAVLPALSTSARTLPVSPSRHPRRRAPARSCRRAEPASFDTTEYQEEQ